MKLNTNLLHNIINMMIIIIPALEQFNWTPFFSNATALKIVAALGLLKIFINVLRDGPTGLVKHQPPVQ